MQYCACACTATKLSSYTSVASLPFESITTGKVGILPEGKSPKSLVAVYNIIIVFRAEQTKAMLSHSTWIKGGFFMASVVSIDYIPPATLY